MEIVIFSPTVESKHSQERGLDFSIDDMAPAHQPIQLKFEVNDSLQYGELEGPNTFLFKQFFTSLNPIRLDVMKEMNTFFKCCFLVGVSYRFHGNRQEDVTCLSDF